MYQKRSFLAVFSKIWPKTPSNKTVAMETEHDLDHQLTRFLPLIDRPNGLPKLKVVESTVSEIMGGGGGSTPSS